MYCSKMGYWSKTFARIALATEDFVCVVPPISSRENLHREGHECMAQGAKAPHSYFLNALIALPKRQGNSTTK
jgi:hypothetical protein